MAEPVWSKYIHPETILEQVQNTAPFLEKRLRALPGPLIEMGGPADGYLNVIASAKQIETLEDYFALCCSAHQATVATFVPTDVDSKIRGILWNETRDPEVLGRMAKFAIQMRDWTVEGISTRVTMDPELGPVSGHNGEWFSVASGGLGRFLQLGMEDPFTELIDQELQRQANAFLKALRKPGREIDTMLLAVSITHNVGDLDQGIGFWEGAAKHSAQKQKFNRLAHENKTPYGGVFQHIAGLYKDCLSAEGHRHYPLRPLKALRRSETLLLPLGPFFDDWGATIGASPLLNDEERGEILDALLKGCKKVENQAGYFRAMAGWQNAHANTFQRAADRLPAGSKKLLREPEMRQKLAVPRRSFESSYAKRVEALRAKLR
jgi:hypothetical protein